jgi:hypothetical protein
MRVAMKTPFTQNISSTRYLGGIWEKASENFLQGTKAAQIQTSPVSQFFFF